MTRALILFEDEGFVDLLPLVFWRSIFELQVGRKIILDRIAQRLGMSVAGVWTRDWIAAVAAQRCGAPANYPLNGPTVLVNGRWLFDEPVDLPRTPTVGTTEDGGQAYIVCDAALAKDLSARELLHAKYRAPALAGVARRPAPGRLIRYPWDLVIQVGDLLRGDWEPRDAHLAGEVPAGVISGPPDQLRVGERAEIHRTALIDTSTGPVYLANDVSVGACAVLEGPLYIGPGSRINPHAWLHGGNAIGPMCKIGGELHRCVIHGYSNKQHNGFLGHSVVGSWVNIGAGASNSDLKNSYDRVSVPINGHDVDSGQILLGAIIGDHAKIGINAALPTGAVIGLGASIASASVPKYVPCFSWVTDGYMRPGDALRAMDYASAMMARRQVDMTDEEVELFSDLTTRVREFEARARS